MTWSFVSRSSSAMCASQRRSQSISWGGVDVIHVILFGKMADDSNRVSTVKKHHQQANLNYNRPKYREARWERAVKVCDCVVVTIFSWVFIMFANKLGQKRITGHWSGCILGVGNYSVHMWHGTKTTKKLKQQKPKKITFYKLGTAFYVRTNWVQI